MGVGGSGTGVDVGDAPGVGDALGVTVSKGSGFNCRPELVSAASTFTEPDERVSMYCASATVPKESDVVTGEATFHTESALYGT